MNASDPERPDQAPVDYPSAPGLPPPIYPPPGYPGATGYHPTYDPYRAVKPPGTNGKAIASLVTSITGCVCCAPLAIVGVVLGVIAMRETKHTGQEGWRMALAGTIIGGLFTVALVIVLLLYFALGVYTLR
ncbi:DUF4190 domain-containing protein [Mycobacterium sp. 29Ha]|uniref:DUF4190 domain-containing protein n=1 Tax=Mycobacterium sp. 29Ha TaxID=2939268 RepID=UPI0029391A31|nr:DUF4190 domain-containing protein [Mycobacterium sp. 29Ha]MDV3134485.1 DUF4190 domain-containing protein [Mycobacterium sp. 29Ha]